LPEGSTNLYYTDERTRDAVGAVLRAGTNVTLDVNDAGDEIIISSFQSPGEIAASDVTYDNELSLLEAHDVQGALDFLAGVVADKSKNLQPFGVAYACTDISTKALSAVFDGYSSGIAWVLPASDAPEDPGYVTGWVDTAPSADTVFDLLVNAVSIGSVTWLSGDNEPFLTLTTDTPLERADYLDVATPANLNGMSGVWRLTVMGFRNG
jgi:hypothetical protein